MNSIDQLCDEFEARRKQGERPDLAEWLRRASADERGQLLQELIAIDVHYRRQAGEQPSAQEYLQQFPDLDMAAISAEFKRPAVEQPTIDTAAPAVTDMYVRADAEGTVIGPFTLERLLGEGGMGSVWVAKQRHPVKRRVALKLIKTGMDSREVVRRFEQERQALAVMDHPNIARVLDAGLTPDGRPYFAMELVNGLPLTAFCDEAKLKTKDRLDIFLQICAAVQHAHQKGVIHRDLKPGNILVTLIDGRPVPKVIDFGVAKALAGKLTEETLSTHFGAVLGTLEYMAPEQAGFSGTDIDTRADIYALGVILYELLTGLRPFDSSRFRQAAMHEIIRIIQEEEPSKPSTRVSTSDSLPSLAAARQIDPKLLSRSLRGDLDWIALKCLEKDRGRRYETANQLALEIQRYLADEPVLAGPPSAGYRLRKFVRRNRLSVVAGSAVLLALVLGLMASLWQMNRAIIAERAAVKSNEEEVKQRLLAVKNATNAKRNADEAHKNALKAEKNAALAAEGNRQARVALDTVMDDVVQNLFTKQAKLGEVEQQFLKKVLAQYDQFTKLAGDSPEALLLKAQGHWKIAMLQGRLGASADAATAFQEMRATYQKLLKANPDSFEYRLNVAVGYRMAGWELHTNGQEAESAELLEESRSLIEALHRDFSKNPKAGEWFGIVAMDRGSNFDRLERLPEAEAAFRQAIEGFRQLAQEHPASDSFRRLLADANLRLTLLLQRAGRSEEAVALTDKALELLDKIGQEHPEELQATHFASLLLTAQQYRGILLFDLGKMESAVEAFRTAIATGESYIKSRPAEPANHASLTGCYMGLANCQQKLGQTSAEIAAWEAAEATAERLVENYPLVAAHSRQLAVVQYSLAWSVWRGPSKAGAVKPFERAIATREDYLAKFPPDLPFREEIPALCEALGHTLSDTGNLARSLELHQRALAKRIELVREFPNNARYRSDVATSHECVSCVHVELKQFIEARVQRELAITILKQLIAEQPKLADYRARLALVYHRAGDRLRSRGAPAEALECYQVALPMREALAADFPEVEEYRRQVAWLSRNRGQIYLEQDRFEEALAEYPACLKSWEAVPHLDKSHAQFRVDCASELDVNADRVRKGGQPAAALPAFRYALTIREKLVADCPLEGAYLLHEGWSRNNIGIALLDLKQPEQAQKEFRQITALMKRQAVELPHDAHHQKLLADLHDKLAEILRARGQLSSADELFRAALAAREQLAFEFPNDGHYGWQIAWSHYHLATIHMARGNQDAAAAEYQKTFAGFEKRLRELPDSVKFAGEFDNMVLQMCEQLETAGQWETIESFAERYRDIVAEIRPKSLLPRATIFSLGGVSLLRQKKFAEAEGMYRKCLELRQKLEPNHWLTFNTRSVLGEVLLEQQKYEEAAIEMNAGYEGMLARRVTIHSSVSQRLPNAVERLIRLAKATNKPEDLKKWQQELERVRAPAANPPAKGAGEND